MSRHNLLIRETCRVLPFLLTAHAVLAVQVPADPGLDPLPVRDHEQVANAGQGQGNVQRQPGGGRPEQEAVVPGGDHIGADGDG